VELPRTEADGIGLCLSCAHAQIVPSRKSTFYLCRLSGSDPRFRKYPVLPVLACSGFAPSSGRCPDPLEEIEREPEKGGA
jgi:hypothetical protein